MLVIDVILSHVIEFLCGILLKVFIKKKLSFKVSAHCLLYFVPLLPDDDLPG